MCARTYSSYNSNTGICPMYSVCIRDAKEAFSVKPRFPDKFNYLTLDVEDNEDQNVIRLFPTYVNTLKSIFAEDIVYAQSEKIHRRCNCRRRKGSCTLQRWIALVFEKCIGKC